MDDVGCCFGRIPPGIDRRLSGRAMVFHKGVMINGNAYRSGPDDFKPAAETRELAEGQMKRVLVEEQPVVLLRLDGTMYALGAVCSHYGAPLNEGHDRGPHNRVSVARFAICA